ncbi:hypothetical protein CFP56_029812 [Quercus suber]|uniref:Uncharacterized protein n=1 Tax=Quercus suber TaxID=58331 RepID=A0AAW0LUZ2_QUESU
MKSHSRHTIIFLHPFAKSTLQISSLAFDLQNPRVRSPFLETRTTTRGGCQPTRYHRFLVDWCFMKPTPRISFLASDV